MLDSLRDLEEFWRGFKEFMRDKPREGDLTLILLNSPSTLRQFVMSIPLSESAVTAVEEALHEEVAPLEPTPGEFSFHP